MTKSARPEPSCLYPDEEELARVLLGDRAAKWPEIAMIEERHGFPRVDPLYGGRYWPEVKAFYDRRYKIEPPPTTTAEVDETRGESFRDRSRKSKRG